MSEMKAVKRHTGSGGGGAGHESPPHAGKRNMAVAEAEPRNVRPQSELADEVKARLGGAQHGAVTRSQLIAAGVNRHVIDRQAHSGALHRRHRGVYIVGHLALAPMAREAAALLACGDRAVISHRSAAYLWGLVDDPPAEVDVTIVGRRCRPHEGLRVRHVSKLALSDVRRKERIRLTSPARAIVELAEEASDPELEGVIAEARAKRLVREGELEAALARAGQRAGTGRLRTLLRSEAGRALTRSEIERICRRLLEAAGLPPPRTNQRLGRYEVDFLWPGERVVLEVDSYGFHGHRRAFERDRSKTMALQDAGYQVIRITPRQLLEDPYWVVAHIARALDRRGRATA